LIEGKIICAPMTEISDANLAIAIDRAGGVGSISPGKARDLNWFDEECSKFTNTVGHNVFVLALPLFYFNTDKTLPLTIKLLRDYTPYCLVILFDEYLTKTLNVFSNIRPILQFCKKSNINLVGRFTGPFTMGINNFSLYDFITLKSKYAAGYYGATESIDLLSSAITNFPDKKYISTGGIYTKEEVALHFDHGAHAIEIGSLFALSKESSLSEKMKTKVFEDLLNNTFQIRNHERKQQYYSPTGKFNLHEGAKGNLAEGHIFLGSKISESFIKPNMTVESIMKELI